jgi:anaerobic ribonucleoside-triphosphate reductase
MEQGYYELAKKYILYRQKHKERRDAQDKLMETYQDIFFTPASNSDFRRENANINTDSSMGIMLKLGTESAKQFVDNYILSPEVEEAHRLGFIHYHDKDFSIITANCLQIDLLKLMKGGFSTGHGHVREPNSIRSAASIACIAIQSSQNDFFGGQAIAAFDFAMAHYVRKSFVKAVKRNLKKIFEVLEIKNDKVASFEFKTSYKNYHKDDADKLGIEEKLFKKAYEISCQDLEDETLQAMEALIHNLNTLHSRCGSQTPFSSLNYGVDTSPEGQLVIDKLLDATWDGLGNGETPIFPIQIFQLKTGYSYKPEDPNYYLFTKACKVSAKRLFPNFLNEDSSFNAPYFKEGNYNSLVCSMG